MVELLVVGFKDNIHRASGLLDELRVLDDHWIREVCDSIALHRDITSALWVDQRYQPTRRKDSIREGTLDILISAALAWSFPSIKSAAIEGVLAEERPEHGMNSPTAISAWEASVLLPEQFISSVDKLLNNGDSAIFAVFDSDDMRIATARFQGYGGVTRSTTLTLVQKEQIEKVLDEGY